MIAFHVCKWDKRQLLDYIDRHIRDSTSRNSPVEELDYAEDTTVTVELWWADGDTLLDAMNAHPPKFPFSAFSAHPSPGFDEHGLATLHSLIVCDGDKIVMVPATADREPVVRFRPNPEEMEAVYAYTTILRQLGFA